MLPSDETLSLLRKRGPDSFQIHTVQHNTKDSNSSKTYHLTFISTVLSLRGDHVHCQPLVDPTSKSVLCWNGEAWKVAGEPVRDNDTELVFKLFLEAVKPPPSATDTTNRRNAVNGLEEVISNISGPFSFVFYDAINSKLFFSRDCLGRRSLLRDIDETGNLKVCSLRDGTHHFEEVSTMGLHMIDLNARDASINTFSIETLPWNHGDQEVYLVCANAIELAVCIAN